jgi:uncharacterized protein (DUF1499 family)
MPRASLPTEPTALQRALALTATIVARMALLAVLFGPIGIHAGWVAPLAGFTAFAAGLLLGLLAALLGVAGFLVARGESAAAARARALTALLTGAALGVVLIVSAWPGRGLPRINDITTTPDDPPMFQVAARDSANAARDMSYPAAFAAQQRAAYPDLLPIPIEQPLADAFVRAQGAASALGWEVMLSSPSEGLLEAQHVSRVFLFVDDIAVRVRPAPGDPSHSLVDVRSKSRVGRGDVGANAKRIRAFRDALSEP